MKVSFRNIVFLVGIFCVPTIVWAAGGQTSAVGDFNGDGNDDIAVGIFDDFVSGKKRAGSVNVQYSTKNRRDFAGITNQLRQGSFPADDEPEDGDSFGRALASGDFDGDGYYDLAVGAPYEDLGNRSDLGVVHAFYGNVSGLNRVGGSRNELWSQDRLNLSQAPEHTGFGGTLVSGDFNGDGYYDLVATSYQASRELGFINVIRGSEAGLVAAGARLWSKADLGFPISQIGGKGAFSALAVGDFNGDDFDDLAIGAASHDVRYENKTYQNAGVVFIIFGSPSGLSVTSPPRFQTVGPGQPGLDVVVNPKEHLGLGRALAVGDFNGDDFDDLAMSRPGTILYSGVSSTSWTSTAYGPGEVFTVAGGEMGLGPVTPIPMTRSTAARSGVANVNDRFGEQLASHDINADGFDDLLVSTQAVPFQGRVAIFMLKGGNPMNREHTTFWDLNAIMATFQERRKRNPQDDDDRPTVPGNSGRR